MVDDNPRAVSSEKNGKKETGKKETGKKETGKKEPGKKEPGKKEPGKSASGKKDGGEEVHLHYYPNTPGPIQGPPSGQVPPPGGYGGYPPHPSPNHYHYYYEPPRFQKPRSSKPTIAAVLLILTAIFGILGGAGMIGMGTFVGDFDNGVDFFDNDPNGDITGIVILVNGTPVTDATVSIDDEELETQTDDEGRFLIYNVPTGEQKLRVEKDGYNTLVQTVFVSPSDIGHKGDWNEDEVDNEFRLTLTEGDGVVEKDESVPWEMIQGLMVFCGVIIIIMSLISLLGGIYAYRRKKYGFAMVGAILGIFTILGTIFALIAVFILAISREEFNGNGK